MRKQRWQQTLPRTGQAAQQQVQPASDGGNERVEHVRAEGMVVLRAAGSGLRKRAADALDGLTRFQPALQRGARTSTPYPRADCQAFPETFFDAFCATCTGTFSGAFPETCSGTRV